MNQMVWFSPQPVIPTPVRLAREVSCPEQLLPFLIRIYTSFFTYCKLILTQNWSIFPCLKAVPSESISERYQATLPYFVVGYVWGVHEDRRLIVVLMVKRWSGGWYFWWNGAGLNFGAEEVFLFFSLVSVIWKFSFEQLPHGSRDGNYVTLR